MVAFCCFPACLGVLCGVSKCFLVVARCLAAVSGHVWAVLVCFGGLTSLLLVAGVFFGLFWGIVGLFGCFGEFFVVA